MKAYHPPMTGLEAEMEEQIAKQGHRPNEALQAAQELRRKKAAKPRQTAADREIEDAMHLGQ